MSLRYEAHALSHVGRLRQKNEDAFFLEPQLRFALLADGMGGHRGGQEASRMTLNRLSERLSELWERLPGLNDDSVRATLAARIKDVSREVHIRGLEDPELHDMGTTLVTWIDLRDRIFVAHAGDSRCYLLRRDALLQVTQDHTYIEEQIRRGTPRSIVSTLPFKHVLTRNIGISPPSEPHVGCIEPKAGDVWLLCSDGLSNLATPEEIRAEMMKAAAGADLSATCRTLVETAYSRGGDDNITVVLLRAH